MSSVVLNNSDHIKKTKTGLKWSFINQFGTQFINIGVSILLARLIEPKEFGLVGMITIFVNFATIFIDFGFSSVLIQKEKVSSEDLNTVFVCNVIIGILLYVSFFFLAPVFASFYKEPRLVLLTRIVSLSFLIAPLNAGRSAMISKIMNFKLSTKISMLSLIVSAFVAIVMAFNGYGVWSIVIQSLVSSITSAIYFRIISDFRPSISFNTTSFKEMISMSSSLVGDSVINYWTRNADNLLIGKFLGSASLGIYNRAYNLMLMPLNNITRVIIRVMLPSFSMIKNNKEEIKRIYLRIVQIIAAITFPMMFGLSATADLLVLTVLGNKWAEMIPLIRMLSIVGALQSILALNGSIYVSQGKANIAFRVTLIFNLFFLIGFIIGLYFGGLNGVAFAYFITSLIGTFPNLYFAIRLIDVKMKDVFDKIGKVLVASVIMGFVVFTIINSGFLSYQPVGIAFLLSIFLGIMLYIILALLLKISIYKEFKNRFVIKLNSFKVSKA